MDLDNQLPRFTRYLRSRGELEPDRSALILFENVGKSSLRRSSEFSVKQILWSDICKEVEKQLGAKSEVLKLLHKLKTLARGLAGEEQPGGVIDEAAIYLFNLFAGYSTVHQKHRILLKKVFGKVSSAAADNLLNVVKDIEEKLPHDVLTKLHGTKEKEKNGTKRSKWELEEYHAPIEIIPDTSYLSDITQYSDCFNSFSMAYQDTDNEKEKKKGSEKKVVYGKTWMTKEVKKCFETENSTGLKIEELCDTLIQLLSSTKSNDELQNELFELLGFDRFELIQVLLEHRSDIILSSALQEDKKINSKNLSEVKRREPVLSQVVVKSQEEKQLEKLARKEEKKLSKFVARDEPYEEEEDFDPVELRAKRVAALIAPTVSISSKERRVAQTREAYPHVYDVMNKAKQQTGLLRR